MGSFFYIVTRSNAEMMYEPSSHKKEMQVWLSYMYSNIRSILGGNREHFLNGVFVKINS